MKSSIEFIGSEVVPNRVDFEPTYSVLGVVRPELELEQGYTPLPDVDRTTLVASGLISEEDLAQADSFRVELDQAREQVIRSGFENGLALGRGKKLKAEHETKKRQYFQLVGKVAISELVDNVEAAPLPNDRAVEFILDKYREESEVFKDTKTVVQDNDNRYRTRLARWYSKRWRAVSTNLAGGVGLGAGLGYGLRKTGKYIATAAGGVAPVAVVGIGILTRTGKAAFAATVQNRAHQIGTRDESAQADHEEFTDQLNKLQESRRALASASIGNVILDATVRFDDVMNKRIETEKSANRKRVMKTVLTVGALGVAGSLLGEYVLPAIAEHSKEFIAYLKKPFDTKVPTHNLAPKVSAPQPQIHHNIAKVHQSVSPKHNHTKVKGSIKPRRAPVIQPNAPTQVEQGLVDGFSTHIDIANGSGYLQAIHQLATEQNANLTSSQELQLYDGLINHFNGQLLVNDSIEKSPGNWWIAHSGEATWHKPVIEYVYKFLKVKKLIKQ